MNGLRKVFPECRTVTLEEVYSDLHYEGKPDRPYVAINMVSSVDGRTTIHGELRKTRIGSEEDRQLMGWVRHAADVVIRGAETVRINPAYPGVKPALVPVRRAKGLQDQPLAVVITNSCDVPLQSQLFTAGPRPIIMTSSTAPAERVDMLREAADVVVVGEDSVDPLTALRTLRSDFGVERVLLEGGPNLNYHFLRQGLVDELFWTVAPKMVGGKGELSWVEGEDVFDPLVQLELISAYTLADELFLRYRVL